MSNKPEIYGFCDARSKWPTVHKEEFENTKEAINDLSNFLRILLPSLLPTNWKTILPSPFTSEINTICYGNGIFVASGYLTVGKRGVAYSTDGLNWTPVDYNPAGSLNSIAYGNGRFVGGAYSVCYSDDGIHWSKAEQSIFGSKNLRSICYGDGKFVAVGDGGVIGYSTDGITWYSNSNTQSVFPSNINLASVCYGNGKFVAIGGNNYMGYSTDGVTWNSITQSVLPGNSSIQDITYGNGKFVAVNLSGQIAYSTDGINWNAGPNYSSYDWRTIYYGDGRFILSASGGKMKASTDGITWTEITQSIIGSSGLVKALFYGNGMYIMGEYYKGGLAYCKMALPEV